jgi:hypothetical protein
MQAIGKLMCTRNDKNAAPGRVCASNANQSNLPAGIMCTTGGENRQFGWSPCTSFLACQKRHQIDKLLRRELPLDRGRWREKFKHYVIAPI